MPEIVEITSSGVIARLEEALRGGVDTPALAFDADGTLWSGDVGVDTFETLLASRGVREAAVASLDAEAERSGVSVSGDPTDRAAALYASFRAGNIPDERAYRMMAWAFAGHSEEEVKIVARRAVAERALAERCHTELLPILAWAHERSVPVFVVSASPHLVVAAALAALGIAIVELAGTRVVRAADGLLADKIEEPMPYGPGKVLALGLIAPSVTLLGAFGDSGFDAELLRHARVPVAVHPKPGLVAAAPGIPGLLRLG